MTEPIRILPEAVRQKVEDGSALLVCGYDDPDKCKQNHLEGSVDSGEFTSRLPSIPKEKEIIFYCA